MKTKVDGKTYSSDVRSTIYGLACAQVSVERMADVVTLVLGKLAKKSVGPLPDPTTTGRIIREMKELSKFQISEALAKEEHTTLKYDGTSKKKMHYVEVQVETKSHSQRVCP